MEMKGNVLIKPTFEHTKLWPAESFSFKFGRIDLEAEYKKALANQIAQVLDIGIDGCYMVIGQSKHPEVGTFAWTIEKEDIAQYMPVNCENGMLIPVGATFMERLLIMSKQFENMSKDF